MSKSKPLLALGAVLVLGTVASAVPALAHEGWIVRTWGKAGTYEAHYHIDVCDQAVDGSVVEARFFMYGVATQQSLGDPDGGGDSCGHEANLYSSVTSHRVWGSAQSYTPAVYH